MTAETFNISLAKSVEEFLLGY